MFRQTIEDGWQREQPDNWLRRPDPWEVARPDECVEVALNCSFEVRAGALQPIPGRPSTLIGMPFDRPVVGYGGKTINTLRLWAAAARDYFDFEQFSHGDFVGALAESLAAESLTRVLYPDDSTTMGQGLRFVQEYFLVACSLADLVRRFRRRNADWSALPDHVAIQLNDTHPAMAVPELMRILLDDAHLPWDQAWDLTRRTLAYTNHTLLPEALEKWPLDWFASPASAPSRDHPRDQPALPRRRPDALPGRRGTRRAREPRRGRSRAEDPDGEPGDRRLAQHERRRGDPLRAAAHDDRPGPGRALPRALQQQDERRDAAALAAAREPGARRRDHRRDRRRLGDRPRRAPAARAARGRRRLSRRVPAGQARRQGAVRRLGSLHDRAGGRPGHASSTAR